MRDVYGNEVKAKRLLKRKRFREAQREFKIDSPDCLRLANSLLTKGKASRRCPTNDPTFAEIVAFSRQVLGFVHAVLDIAASFSVQVFASMVSPEAPRPEPGKLRKDYVYLFERYFYYLETLPPRERGIVVFDELEKSQAHRLLQQMAAYFLGSPTGQYRSSRIVPEPFFVHSDLTTGVFLADLTAYILGWGWRLNRMPQAAREECNPTPQSYTTCSFTVRSRSPTRVAIGNYTASPTSTIFAANGIAARSPKKNEGSGQPLRANQSLRMKL
ncbi:MAG TPA: DUF3800 domain-containing protein [Pirellulales bacterium]|nr:DUF3800 domain-containing protein [Pirellulales bacterium]